MNLLKFLCLLLVGFGTSSCAFNKVFHKSAKMPPESDITKFSYFIAGRDTTHIQYDEANEEINFLNQSLQLINTDYSIKSEYFPSSSGHRLHGLMLKPKNIKPIGLVLHFHGSAANVLFHYKAIAPLVEKGFQVFTFDYSGYGFSEGKSTRKNVLSDAYSALEYISGRKDLQYESLLIYGQSYGGYLASIVGSNNQDKIDGLIIEGAFSSHKEEAKYKVPFFGNLVKEGITAEKEIRKNFKPVLVIHSTEDTMVPLKFGKGIYKNANSPKDFFEIDKAHLLGLQYYADEITTKVKDLMYKD